MVIEIGMPVRKATEIIGGVEARGISEGLAAAGKPAPRWSGGGRARTIQDRTLQSKLQAEQRARAELTKQQKKQLEAEKFKVYEQLREQFQSQLRQAKGVQEKYKIRQAYQQQLGQATYQYVEQKKAAGTPEFRGKLIPGPGTPFQKIIAREKTLRQLTPQQKVQEILKTQIATGMETKRLIEQQKELELQARREKASLPKIEAYFEKQKTKEGALPPLEFGGLKSVIETIRDPSSHPEIVSGEKFTPFAPQFFLGGKIAETEAYKKFGETLKQSSQIKEFIEQPAPDWLISTTASVPLSIFFSPAFQTGISQKEIQKQLSKTKFDKLGKFVNKARADLVGKKAGTEQIKYLNDLAKLVNKNDPKQVANFKEFVRLLYEEGTFKGIPLGTPKTTTETLSVYVEGLPTMESVGSVVGGVVGVQPKTEVGEMILNVEEVKQVNWLGVGGKQKIKEKLKELEKVKEKQVLGLIQPSALAQVPRLAQPPRQAFAPALAQPTLQVLKQAGRTRPALKQIPKLKIKPRLKFPLFVKPKAVVTAKQYKVIKKAEGEYSIYIRREGKWFKVGEEETLTQATIRAKGIVSTTLAASFQIRKDKAPVKIDIWGKEFRPAKREPFTYVQKRKYRLSTLPEVKEIQLFKKKAKKKGRKLKWL